MGTGVSNMVKSLYSNPSTVKAYYIWVKIFNISLYTGAPIILIVVAVITSLIAFFGCCGAVKVIFSLFMNVIPL